MLTDTIEDKITEIYPYSMLEYDNKITKFYSNIFSSKTVLLQAATNLFINQPYFFEPLGEGADACYSQEPLYRTDKFDCVTYVDTILSLYNAKNLEEFKYNMLKIRYLNGEINYALRTDWFTDLEWIPRARQLGWITDFTNLIVTKLNHSIAEIATTYIEKQNWYAVKPLKSMHRLSPLPSKTEAQRLLTQLRCIGKQFQNHKSKISYLPLKDLFLNNTANLYLFDQIPSGSIIIIVRPNWPIRDSFPNFPYGYGTNLNVSHLGIALRINNELRFYHASSLHEKVKNENLIGYLQKYINHDSIKGIHIEKMV